MLFGVLFIGLLFLIVVAKLVKGALKLVLIVILLILIILGSIFSKDKPPVASADNVPQVVDAA